MKNLSFIKRNLYVFIAYYCTWLFEFYFIFPVQEYFLNYNLDVSPSLLFLPHGIRVLTVLAYGPQVFIGLLLAHIFAGFLIIDISNNMNLIIMLSLGSVCSVFLAIFLIISSFNKISLNKINLKNIFLIAVISSILNSLSQSLIIKKYINNQDELYNFLGYLIGDIAGTIFLFYIIIKLNNNNNLIKLIKKL